MIFWITLFSHFLEHFFRFRDGDPFWSQKNERVIHHKNACTRPKKRHRINTARVKCSLSSFSGEFYTDSLDGAYVSEVENDIASTVPELTAERAITKAKENSGHQEDHTQNVMFSEVSLS